MSDLATRTSTVSICVTGSPPVRRRLITASSGEQCRNATGGNGDHKDD
jgi:hypothetical protein